MCEQQFTSDLIKQFQRRRYDLGLTQHAMDSMLGVSPGVVAKWEIGNRKPTLFNAYCCAEALGCSLRLEVRDENLRD